MSWSTLQKFAEFLPHLLMFSIIKKIYSIKQRKKNLRKSTRVHLPNSRSGSWDWDNTIEKKKKKKRNQLEKSSPIKNDFELTF